MNLNEWFREKFFGPPDPVKPAVVEKIEREVSRLNGATTDLAKEVRTIKADREEKRPEFTKMLDETLAALNKGKQQE